MKSRCVGCTILTKNTYNIFGVGEPYLVPMCRKCLLRTVPEIKSEQRRQIMAKARAARWKNRKINID